MKETSLNRIAELGKIVQELALDYQQATRWVTLSVISLPESFRPRHESILKASLARRLEALQEATNELLHLVSYEEQHLDDNLGRRR